MTTFPQHIFKRISIITCLLISGCAFSPMPDSCCHEPSCELGYESTVKPSSLKIGEEKTLHICACKPWNASEIQVNQGEQYSFAYDNVVNWVDGTIPSSPTTGWQGTSYQFLGKLVSPYRRSDKSDWYALVGSIGLKEDEVFFASDTGSVEMKKSGVVYFYANDKIGRYFNNKGTLRLTMTRVK